MAYLPLIEHIYHHLLPYVAISCQVCLCTAIYTTGLLTLLELRPNRYKPQGNLGLG